MPLIPFPDVPLLPGVPAIPRLPNIPTTFDEAKNLLINVAIQVTGASAPRWGIYQNGKPIADVVYSGFGAGSENALIRRWFAQANFSSTVDLTYSKETRVSDFPVERGGFASYNKVELPSTPVVTMAVEGSDQERAKFLSVIDKATKEINKDNLFVVVTPETDYINHTVEGYEYTRAADNGAYLLLVKIKLKEIRQVSPQYSLTQNAKDPSAASQANGGQAQAQPATAAQKNKADGLDDLVNRIMLDDLVARL